MKKLASKLVIVLSILTTLPLYGFPWGSQIVNSGGYPTGDTILTAVIYGGTNWNECFQTGPCTFADIITPLYGSNYFYYGYQDQALYRELETPPYGYVNVYTWGWSFDQNMYANNAAEMNTLSTTPFNDTGQIRWIQYRGKAWRPDGSIFANYPPVPQWVIDNNQLFYPDNSYFDYGTQQVVQGYDYSRLTNGNWNFRVWDHPGITDLYHHIRADGNYIDSALYYVNFYSDFYVNGQQATPSIGYALKVLLRQDPTLSCASGLNGNIAWVWGQINIPDWQNPPNGLTLP